MKLHELLDVYDGNATVTVNQEDEALFYEQDVEEILEDSEYKAIKNAEVDSFGIEISDDEEGTPILYIDLA
ncbi:MAG: hypothetical protein K5669_12780 [Lachnospiraceae bacterium]|nr:hypothetical protein [Lachnospiraceae bacterium]